MAKNTDQALIDDEDLSDSARKIKQMKEKEKARLAALAVKQREMKMARRAEIGRLLERLDLSEYSNETITGALEEMRDAVARDDKVRLKAIREKGKKAIARMNAEAEKASAEKSAARPASGVSSFPVGDAPAGGESGGNSGGFNG